MNADASALAGAPLGGRDQRGAMAAPAMLSGNPELGDIQPSPADLAEQPAGDGAVSVAKEDADFLFARVADPFDVEGQQASLDRRDVVLSRAGLDSEAERVGHAEVS